MGRRTSGAQVGIEKIGLVQANNNTLTTSQPNQNIVIDPNGTGVTEIVGNALISGNGSTGGELRLADADSSHYTLLRTASTTTANRTLTFPNSAGSNGNVLSTDGSGNLSWVSQTAAGVSSSDPGASATTHYPFFGTSSGSIPTGQLTSINVRANLSFQPSTGTLTTTVIVAPTINGSTAASNQLTIRGTSNGTKNTASVLFNDGVNSSSIITGTIVVTGGVGMSGNQYIGGQLVVTNGTASTGTTTGAAIITGGVGVGGALYVGGVLGAGGGTSGIIGYTAVSTTQTLSDADRYYIATNTFAITLTLPATTTTGRTIVIADGANFQTNNVTIGRNGRNIGGLAENLVLNVRGSRVELVYVGTGTDWKVFIY